MSAYFFLDARKPNAGDGYAFPIEAVTPARDAEPLRGTERGKRGDATPSE